MNNDFVVYSGRIARILINMGFKVTGTAINAQYPRYVVFYFENTQELVNAFNAIKNAK